VRTSFAWEAASNVVLEGGFDEEGGWGVDVAILLGN
jgi:hypothetical protein